MRVLPAESIVVRNSASFVWQRTTPAPLQEARALHLRGRRPARAAVGAAIRRGLAPQGRHGGHAGTGQGRGRGHGARVAKEDRGARCELPAPEDPLPRSVEARSSERRPRGAERGRVRERRRDVLRCAPASSDREHDQGHVRQEPHPLLHARGGGGMSPGPSEANRVRCVAAHWLIETKRESVLSVAPRTATRLPQNLRQPLKNARRGALTLSAHPRRAGG